MGVSNMIYTIKAKHEDGGLVRFQFPFVIDALRKAFDLEVRGYSIVVMEQEKRS